MTGPFRSGGTGSVPAGAALAGTGSGGGGLDYRALHLPAEPVTGQLPREPVSLSGQPLDGQVDDMKLLLHSGCHEPGMDG